MKIIKALALVILNHGLFAIAFGTAWAQDDDAENVVPFPKNEEAAHRREAALKDICHSLMAEYFPDEVRLKVGQVFLYDHQPVLILSGSFLKNGRISNFWDWRDVHPDRFGTDVRHDYDNAGRFTRLPEGSRFHLDLSRATPVLGGERPRKLASDVYLRGNRHVLLVGGHRLSSMNRYLVLWVPIEHDGHLGSDAVTEEISIDRFHREWHRVENYDLSVRGD